ncbi:hypothetical protein EC973_005558 [Apophysomyces ossiformis]|uniref:Peptidase S1 domain-containing protein n=1 Tax=Apophysomyces ossiformis TaxID=679940 RepID=A0A8H7BJ50_9FUNG|nr:hypothetical protein EC973_005558 [Apophysomyces ossiformis]
MQKALLRSISSTTRALQANQAPVKAYRTIGLRREDKSRWERRVALTPDAVERLIQQTGTRVYVQPSTKRIFSDESYKKAGAIVTEDLSAADVILGIKEVPEASLIPGKTYLFFSHTHKGNQKNMPMLKSILDKDIRLIDYELMKDETGKRLVAFGQFAGNAGMVDALHGMGQRFLGLGYSTPFMYMSMAHAYRSVASAKLAVRSVGNNIEDEGTPKDFGPLVYAFTGDGNVAHGALDIFKELPHEFVPAADLPKLVKDKNPNLKKVYATHLDIADYIKGKDGSPVTSHQDYFDNPSKYQSTFHESIAPYVNCVVTGAYWDQRYPRLLTNDQLRDIQLRQSQGIIHKGKMMTLADIVCDIRGAFESLSHSTNVEDGFYYYDAIKNQEHKDDEGQGMQILGIDILPAELPIESSKFFSDKLFPYVKELIQPSAKTLSDLSPLLANATIADSGKLTQAHRGLEKLLPSTLSTGVNQKKTVLLLGSGMVAAPLVNHLLKRPDVRVVVGSNVSAEATALVAGRDNAESVSLDISDKEQLTRLVSGADVVVSFVPAFLHTGVAEVCVQQRKHMVTASYVSKEMQALDASAKASDVLIMNEVGLDPGIDHMSAMKIIDDAKRRNLKVRSFISWCGGLPAPEASNTPLGYKFSWSPRGVLTASGNDATYWTGGKVQATKANFQMGCELTLKYTIAGRDLLRDHFPVVRTPFQGFVFEGLANRDSLSYVDTYGLGDLKDMDTMFRGTLRYQGYSDLLYAFRKLGFLDQTSPFASTNWDQYFAHVLSSGKQQKLSESDRLQILTSKLGLAKDHPLTERVWDALTMLSSEKSATPSSPSSALDSLSILLARQLKYGQGERDMVAMHHEFGLEHPSGKKETVTSTLIDYGNEHHTAMAKTVGLPAAMTVDLVLDNKIPERGVLRPTMSHVYSPILERLEHEGVRFIEQVHPSHPIRLDATGSDRCNCIANGAAVTDAIKYPFFVSFIKPALCGGVLISVDPPWVLTAAHCLFPGKTPSLVGFGGLQMRRYYASIQYSVTHPQYDPTMAHTSEDALYDIGLVRLKTISSEASRVAIGSSNHDQIRGTTLGMGYLGLNESAAEKLQTTECYIAQYSDSMLYTTSDAVLCHGDSGGPLLNWVGDQYVVMGILNRVINAYDPMPDNATCPLRQHQDEPMYNAFVKAAYHMDWITNTTQLSAQMLTASAQKLMLPVSKSFGHKSVEDPLTILTGIVLCALLCNLL